MKLVITTGRTVAVVARELGIQESTLGRWVHDFRDRAAAGEAGQGGLSETERAELLRLRRENSDLKLDRAFLENGEVVPGQNLVFEGGEERFGSSIVKTRSDPSHRLPDPEFVLTQQRETARGVGRAAVGVKPKSA